MRTAKYFTVSALAALAVLYHAFATRQHFYPSMLYLSTSKLAVAVVGNLAFATALLVQKAVIKIFLGSLRDIENEMIKDKLSSAIMESLLALTIFREEFNAFFLAMFASLVFVKVLHWLVQNRVDYIEVTPTVSRLQHLRIVLFMSVLLAVDAVMLNYTVHGTIQSGGQSVMLLFAFEYVIQASDIVRYFLKYVMSMIDLFLDGRWESKGTYVFYLELMTDMLHLFVYVFFFAIVFTNYGMPLHLIRDLYATFRNFRNRIIDFLRFRQVSARLGRLPDATADDLARSDGVCIICREEMTAAGSNKKLFCGHVFHLHCLRSWLERQQNCPTCRGSVFQRRGDRGPRAAAVPAAARAGAAAPGGAAAGAAAGAGADLGHGAHRAHGPHGAHGHRHGLHPAHPHAHAHPLLHLPHQHHHLVFMPNRRAAAQGAAAAGGMQQGAGAGGAAAGTAAEGQATAAGQQGSQAGGAAGAGVPQFSPFFGMAPPGVMQFAGQQAASMALPYGYGLGPGLAGSLPMAASIGGMFMPPPPLMMPMLPTVLPPLMPPPAPGNALEQQAAAAAAAAAMAAAAAVGAYNPMGGLVPLFGQGPSPLFPSSGLLGMSPEILASLCAGNPQAVAALKATLDKQEQALKEQLELARQNNNQMLAALEAAVEAAERSAAAAAAAGAANANSATGAASGTSAAGASNVPAGSSSVNHATGAAGAGSTVPTATATPGTAATATAGGVQAGSSSAATPAVGAAGSNSKPAEGSAAAAEARQAEKSELAPAAETAPTPAAAFAAEVASTPAALGPKAEAAAAGAAEASAAEPGSSSSGASGSAEGPQGESQEQAELRRRRLQHFQQQQQAVKDGQGQ